MSLPVQAFGNLLNPLGKGHPITPPAASYLLLEDGSKLILEDGSGDLILE